MKAESEVDEKEMLMKQLRALNTAVNRVGTENRMGFDEAACRIQAFVRGRMLRKVLKPYFDLN